MPHKMTLLYLLFASVFFVSCHSPAIVVQSEYLTHEYLASSYIHTPDPLQSKSFLGQRLIISWMLPDTCPCEELLMTMRIRFRNRTEEEQKILLKQRSGTYVFDLINERFCASGGVLTYKIDIVSENKTVAEWRHQLWAELLQFEEVGIQSEAAILPLNF